MATKLLFILVIVAAHCAVASGWVRPENPKDKLAMASCVKSPTALPLFTPPREVLAMTFVPLVYAERMQP